MIDMDLKSCPFCSHEGPFDQWPCEWLDGTGENVVRCPCCHGAAPMRKWNIRANHEVGEAKVFGWISPTSLPPDHGCVFTTIYSEGYMELLGDLPRIPLYTIQEAAR